MEIYKVALLWWDGLKNSEKIRLSTKHFNILNHIEMKITQEDIIKMYKQEYGK